MKTLFEVRGEAQRDRAFGWALTRDSKAPSPLRSAGAVQTILLLALVLISFGQPFAQTPATNATPVQFRAVDVFVDTQTAPLAAYQIEFTVASGNAKIVGIEGGEHEAFAEPPFYDPEAMQHERVIIAAFSTDVPEQLPNGRTRVATIHLRVSAGSELKFETKLQTAAGADGRKIHAEAISMERKK